MPKPPPKLSSKPQTTSCCWDDGQTATVVTELGNLIPFGFSQHHVSLIAGLVVAFKQRSKKQGRLTLAHQQTTRDSNHPRLTEARHCRNGYHSGKWNCATATSTKRISNCGEAGGANNLTKGKANTHRVTNKGQFNYFKLRPTA